MKQLENMKESLMSVAHSQINGNLYGVDAKELGEVIDMIKDLEEAIYYCTITEAMKKGDLNHRDLDREQGRMYYDGGPYQPQRIKPVNNNNGYKTQKEGYYDRPETPYEYPQELLRDKREGKSPKTRKMYMESKELHHDKEIHMQELEKYLQELSHDITEMIQDASPEEKQMLQQKLSVLVTKIK